VIDLGPGGGVNGGEIVVEGTPERVAAEAKSYTGQYLRPLLARSTSTAHPEERLSETEGASRRTAKPRKSKVAEDVAAE